MQKIDVGIQLHLDKVRGRAGFFDFTEIATFGHNWVGEETVADGRCALRKRKAQRQKKRGLAGTAPQTAPRRRNKRWVGAAADHH